MKKISLTITFLILAYSGYGQNNPFIKFSHQIESEIANETIRSSRAGTLYSLIGDYYQANSYSDISVSWGVNTIQLDAYQTEEALTHIVNEAQKHQIIIISENHLKPQHRIFANQIITALVKHGFQHLGLETLNNTSNNGYALLDSNLMDRGYPLDDPLTGTYTMEPKMGELLRNAISLEYKIFAYERFERIKGKDRDEIQADNIIKYLNVHPEAKLIIFCGFHHAIESDQPKRVKHQWMARYVKDKTGIDPLTIYQDNFTEKFIQNEHPYLKQTRITEPSVFIDNDGHLVKLSKHVDVEVLHPMTRFRNGRPDWLYENSEYIAVEVLLEKQEMDFPVIVSAFRKGEVNGVPADRIELKHKYDNKVLVLKKGEYNISIFDGVNYYEYKELVE